MTPVPVCAGEQAATAGLRASVPAWVAAAFLATMLASVPAAAELADTIARIKPSIVAVGSFEQTRNPRFQFFGTGFALGDGRLIATSAHVVSEWLDDSRRETLAIVVPGAEESAVRPARRVATDREHDLVLLEITGDPLPALRLRERDDVREGRQYAFTGFPVGGALGFAQATHRATVSAISPIVVPVANSRELNPMVRRQLDRGAFLIYQLDATAYPGSSGSPLFDPDTGEVVAILNAVYVKSIKEHPLSNPSGISYAIPAKYLRELLNRSR